MAQHDMNIANQGFPATRADINNALQALVSNSSGTSAPSTTFANQWWYDTTNNKLYIRNEANNAWIQVAVLDQTNNEWQITTGQITAGDSDGLVFKTDDGNTRITLSDGGDVTFADGTDIITATAGTDNVRIGEGAGDSIASGGDNNVVMGKNAGTSISTGDGNVAMGKEALFSNTTADNNVALGMNAGYTNTTGHSNNFMGRNAGYSNTTGSANTGLGHNALNSNTTASNNTAVGYQAGYSNSTGTGNVYVGRLAGNSTTSSYNTLVGEAAGNTVTSGQLNAFFGNNSGGAMTTGSNNVIIGSYDGNSDGTDLRTDSNTISLSDGSGNLRCLFNDNGYFRFKSINAAFAGGATHTITHDNNDTEGFLFEQQHGSFVSSAVKINAYRVANSGYEMLLTRSGNNADVEHYLRGDGNAYADGSWNGGGADYAEYFEWSDGNSDNQDRTGYTVVLDGNKIKLSTSDDAAANVIGAVSVNPSVVGDSDIQRWKGKYLLDDFGAYQTEEYTETWWIDENNVKQSYNTDKIPDGVTVPDDATVDTKDEKDNTLVRRKLNPDYDADQAYVSREDRKEWATIGMMGKLRIRKGQKTGDRWIKMRDISDTVEEWLVR